MADRYAVRLTHAALADLDAIGDHLAQHRGLDEAEALIERLRAHVRLLERFPFRGPVPKELEDVGREDIRQTVLGRHRIFYRVGDSEVFVFMFIDGRRDVDALLAARMLARGDSP